MLRRAAMIVGIVMLAGGFTVMAGQSLVGAASAVYHEGVVTFQVNHNDAVSIQVVVFDGATNAILFDSGATRGSRIEWAAGRVSGDALRYTVKAWARDGSLVLSQNAKSMDVDEISSISFDDMPTGTVMKAAGDPIRFEGDVHVGPSAGQQRIELENGAAYGGVRTYDNTGGTPASVSYMGGSSNGVGGYMGLNGTSLFTGWMMDGIGQGNGGQPIMTVIGSDSFATFDTGATGDDAVRLATGSVSSVEIGNEPGVAGWSSTSVTAMTDTMDILVASTITAPTDGYVVVVAECALNFNHIYETATGVEFGISLDQATLPGDQDKWIKLPANNPTGEYWDTGSALYIGAVTAGSHTFTLMGREVSGGDVKAYERNISIMFFPTAYGTVSGSKAGYIDDDAKEADYDAVESMTREDVEVERQMSIAADQQRMAAEMAAMQQRLNEMQAELKASGGASHQ